jgi:ATP-binding cassette, subfamily C, bacterial LapB
MDDYTAAMTGAIAPPAAWIRFSMSDNLPHEPSDRSSGSAKHGRDPLVEALVYLARAHGTQVSREGLTAGLPLHQGRLTPSLVARAAERAGLDTRLVECPLAALAEETLPAILLLEDEDACVLLTLDGSAARIVGTRGTEETVTLAALQQRYIGSAILSRARYEFDERAPELGKIPSRHWFVSAMARHVPLYRDVMVAAAMVNLFALGLPLFTMNVYDRVVPNRAVETLWMLAAGLVLLLLAEFVLRSMRGYFLDLASKRVDVDMSAYIMERVLGMRLEARPASVGSLAANLRSFETVRDFITSATITGLIDLPFTALFLIVIAWIAWPMVLPALVGMLVVLLYATLVASRMHELSETTYRAAAMRNSSLVESLVGLESVKAHGVEGVMQSRWERSANYLAERGAQLRLLAASTLHVALLAQQLTAVSVIVIGVYLISSVQLSLGGLIACSMLTARALAPMSQIAGLMAQYHHARTALRALEEIVERPVERPAGAHFLSRQSFRGEIEFRDVSFAYPNSETSALRGVSFRIAAGEKVAILGRTGSGKSTLLRLMLGLYRPISGAVLIDGIDLRQLDPGELRRNVGYVPQDIMLFYGTLRENLTIGAPQVEDADIMRATELGNLAELVNLHPKGIDMPVGERGESLSGGQRAGVAIARAVINKPPILLLDEPTGSMDHSSEEAVKTRLREFALDRTMVIVTHRTALLELVDRIIVTDNGKIVADGPKASVVEALQQGRVGRGA